MKGTKKFTFIILTIALMLGLTGCYWNDIANPNQMAVQLDEGAIKSISGPGGKYTDLGMFSELLLVNVDTLTFQVEDPSVLTSDNQEVGVRITVQARRKADNASMQNIVTNWYQLIDDQQFTNTVSSTASEAIKNGTRVYTLYELLDDRNGLADAVKKQLQQDADNYSGEIINVTINDIAPSTKYMDILSEKANLTAQTATELERRKLIEQTAQNNILQATKDAEVKKAQLAAEKAKTDVELEIATREGKKTAAQQQVFVDNPQAYFLEQLRLVDDIMDGSQVYYLPEGTDLTGVFGLDKLVK